ncbi:MAG: glycosyl hydrolase [Chloroflexi bacterium]|nr:glycosyl hydrolase [Chloroflexota bacterium]MCI0646849.1 glycosyl hydrolase [Chloroflexota bacterium]MCI0726952.1 glycosyl hydrolase [Chloroflexota bacterium]
MARRHSILPWILFLGIFFLACVRLRPVSRPLPTLAPTAVGLVAITDTPRLLATASASPPSAPSDVPVATATPSPSGPFVARPSPAALPHLVLTTAPAIQPPATASSEATATTTPSVTPSNTPQPTATPPPIPSITPTPLPLPPSAAWPAPTAHPFPTASTPRQGVAAAWGGPGNPFGAWVFAWNPGVPVTPSPWEHVPMLVGGPRNGLPDWATIAEYDARNPHNYWLVFNECEHQGQCNSPPQEVARFYHDQVVELLYNQAADPDAELIIGGVNAHPCGIAWLEEFVTYYEATYGPIPRAGWHFHLYPEIQPVGAPAGCQGPWEYRDYLFPDPATAFALWQEQANNTLAFVQHYGRPEDQIWFTEMGCLNLGFHQEQRPVCQAEGFMAGYVPRILAWLNGDGRWVTRYAWFTNWTPGGSSVTRLWAADRPWQYSSLGWFYAQVTPAAAVPLPWP